MRVRKQDQVDYLQGVASYVGNLIDTFYELAYTDRAEAHDLDAWINENVEALQAVFNYCGGGQVERA